MKGLRLKNLREKAGLTQKELAEMVNITPKAISFYELEQREPSSDLLIQFSKIFNVSTDYLLNNKIDFNLAKTNIRPLNNEKTAAIKVLGRIAAGVPIEAIEEVIDTEEVIINDNDDPEQYFGLKIKGDNMAPRILEGDVVICRKQSSVDSNEIAVVFINGYDATLKRIKKSESGITLIPDNPSYPPKFFTNEEIEKLPITILGKVVELRGKF